MGKMANLMKQKNKCVRLLHELEEAFGKTMVEKNESIATLNSIIKDKNREIDSLKGTLQVLTQPKPLTEEDMERKLRHYMDE